jgi:hypothetical protein
MLSPLASLLSCLLVGLLAWTDSSSRGNNVDLKTKAASCSMSKKYETDGPEAAEIAKYLPYFPFKGISRFYDIGGFLNEPAVFQRIVNIFVDRYDEIGIDVIAG